MANSRRGATASEEAVLELVRTLVLEVLGGQPVTVYLFGSWANGTIRPSSDIDVAVEARGPLPAGTLSRLREALEESTIPYRVDVVDLSDTDREFRDRVRREGTRWIACENA